MYYYITHQQLPICCVPSVRPFLSVTFYLFYTSLHVRRVLSTHWVCSAPSFFHNLLQKQCVQALPLSLRLSLDDRSHKNNHLRKAMPSAQQSCCYRRHCSCHTTTTTFLSGYVATAHRLYSPFRTLPSFLVFSLLQSHLALCC